jgi:hypothetical protein
MMRADAGLHPDQARLHVSKPRFHLAARPLLSQHNRPALVVAYDVERVLSDIDPDHSNWPVEFLWHGVLLELAAPASFLAAGLEHGRTIPLADDRRSNLLCCTMQLNDVVGCAPRLEDIAHEAT